MSRMMGLQRLRPSHTLPTVDTARLFKQPDLGRSAVWGDNCPSNEVITILAVS